MKIIGCEMFIVALPLRRSHVWASNVGRRIGRHAIVRVDSDEGVSGWGEAPALPTWGGHAMRYYGETPETVRHVITDLLIPAVEGLDPAEIDVVHSRMDGAIKGHPYAKAAVDMACYDLTGKAFGIPVWKLLGGRHRDGIEVAHSLGIMDVEAAVDEAVEAVGEGAITIKCKTGLDSERDVQLVERLRESLGDDVKIRVDGNEGYATVHEAVSVTKRQEAFGIMLCEQPVAGAAALREVAERVGTEVMADESAWTSADILELDSFGIRCFSCYVTKPGGLYRARRQAAIASDLGFTSDIGGSIEMGIGNAANLHLGVATDIAVLPSVCPVTKPEGRSGPDIAGVYYEDDIVTESFSFRDGRVMVPEGPGLGIEVDMDKLARYSG
jgi:muconate cycloisomerase